MEQALQDLVTIALQVAIMFVLIGVGGGITKAGMLKSTGAGQITDILLYIVTPCLIVNSFLEVTFGAETVRQLLICTVCAVLTHVLGAVVALVFCKKRPQARRAVLQNCVIFSNGGFMSIPLAQALIGAKGVFLVSVYVVVFNLLTWTYGVTLFRSDGKLDWRKICLNPGTIGILVGLPLFLLNVQVTPIIGRPISYLASLNTPVAMMLTGFHLVTSKLWSGLKDAWLWLTCLLRLMVVPGLALAVFKLGFGLSGELLAACMIPACAPCAVSNMLLASKFGGDAALASRIISVSTLLSIVTMPLMLTVANL